MTSGLGMLLIYGRDRYLNPNGIFPARGCTQLPMSISPKSCLAVQLMDPGTVGFCLLFVRVAFPPGKQIVPTEADVISVG